MDVIGIICEYNPFHYGHLYHLNKIRELHNKALIVLVINGYFMQRGEVSILSKEDKTKIALNHGIDIVVELPTIYGTQSADIFASKAVEILNMFKVNYINFGLETNDIKKITNIVLLQNTANYQKDVKKYLDLGLSYPTAMAKACKINNSFFTPNNLLGISYIKAINIINKDIIPESILRTNNYHDLDSNEKIISASNIRNKIKNGVDIKKYVLDDVYSLINKIDENKLFELIKVIILRDKLDSYLTVDEGIDYRIKKYINNCQTLEELINKVKTKRYTYNKLQRMFIHILLGIKKDTIPSNISYIKILGFNKQGQKYLKTLRKELPLDIDYNSECFKTELLAAYIYEIISNKKTINFELMNKPLIY